MRTSDWCTVHDFELGDCFALIVLVRGRASRLPTDDGEFHVLDLDSHEEKVDFADDHILEVVSVSVNCQKTHKNLYDTWK